METIIPTINIQVLSVTPTHVPNAKGGYDTLDVAFKNLTFNKVEQKKIMSFGAGKSAFTVLKNALNGQTYTVEVVKNDKGYLDWVSVSQAATGQATPSSVSQGQGLSTPAPRSNFETPEERAKKQIYIVRQSSIGSAIELLSVGAKASPKVEDVLNVAKQLEDYVFGASLAAPDAGFFPKDPQVDAELDDPIPF